MVSTPTSGISLLFEKYFALILGKKFQFHIVHKQFGILRNVHKFVQLQSILSLSGSQKGCTNFLVNRKIRRRRRFFCTNDLIGHTTIIISPTDLNFAFEGIRSPSGFFTACCVTIMLCNLCNQIKRVMVRKPH